MINRALIRLKIVQIIYSFYKNEGRSINTAEKELSFSLSKAHDLYNHLLYLMVELTKYKQKKIEAGKAKRNPSEEELNPNTKFVDNLFIKQLANNIYLKEYISKQKRTWSDEENFIEELYKTISETKTFKEYMSAPKGGYEEDKEFWRKIYKECISKNEEIDRVLEEQSLYWNDDKTIIDTFVVKTIKKFKQEAGDEQELLPEYRTDEDKEFAIKLFRKAIEQADQNKTLIENHIENWDIERIAFMDIVIMQIALAEILNFPNIPTNVSIDEYVEISKWYSTPKSSGFINATLDACVNKLKSENKINKLS